jgi:hypothetical protein
MRIADLKTQHGLAAIVVTILLSACAYQPSMPPPPIKAGMDTTTLTTYYGRPVRINSSGDGTQQWVFRQMCQAGRLFQDNLYVYVKDNHVVSWQQFDCYY